MAEQKMLSAGELEEGLENIRQSPRDAGILRLIVRRPAVGEREELSIGELCLREGLVGDNWATRGCPLTPDGLASPDMQINVMNARVIELVAADRTRWALAGDELYVDLDLSEDNLPPGSQLSIGSAVIEVTAQPHTGCKKFIERFGMDAVKFVNSPVGKKMRLRGLNAKVVQPGIIHVGDRVQKAQPT
jgi:hypothetical protein